MQYVSTRGHGPYSFEDAALKGWGDDGGMILPQVFPQLSKEEVASMQGESYSKVAFQLLRLFIDSSSMSDSELTLILDDAFAQLKTPCRILS